MTLHDEVRAQLAGELGTHADDLTSLTGDTGLPDQVARAVPVIAAALAAGTPEGARCAQMVVSVLWAGNPPREWWGTPLGIVCAGLTGGDGISVSDAATVLGVTRQAVYTMVARSAAGDGGGGGLEQHPDGATRASVMARARATGRAPAS